MIKVEETKLDGVKIITPRVLGDERGFFMESFNAREAKQRGLTTGFVQDNHSQSTRGVLRGLHYQYPQWQAKLVRVVRGEIFDVAVDLRHGTPTFGKWTGAYLSDQNKRQLFIPEGFAHGFCVMSKTAHFLYKCSDFYASDDECGINWSDPDIAIDWPVKNPIISTKDKQNPNLCDLPPEQLPSAEKSR